MKALTTAAQIRDALKKLQPTRVAVAFIGEGWKKYISIHTLEEIIISPTNGSNPKAIEQLMAELGEARVHFLDNLHAKIFLGKSATVVGSCNLSNNGMADNKLLEVAVLTQEPVLIKQLADTFEDYKTRAIKLYPNEKSKRAKLIELAKQWQIAEWHGLNTEQTSETLLTDYQSILDRIHIVGFSGGLEYNKDIITTSIPETHGISLDDYFTEACSFLEEDDVIPGDWILNFDARLDGYPRKNGGIKWTHIHHVVSHGVIDSNNPDFKHTKLVGQAENLKCPKPPFKLDKQIKNLIYQLLASNEFPAILNQDNIDGGLALADKEVPTFRKKLQEKLRMAT
jgi:hypothetical protein